MSSISIKRDSIIFPKNNSAVVVFPNSSDTVEGIVAALALKSYKAVILILGGADTLDEKFKPRLIQLFGRGIARAATETEAVIVDGGTQSGVMSLMGEGVADRGHTTNLLGVAPAELVSYPGKPEGTVPLEVNHTHFVLVEGNSWDSKSAMMFDLVKALSGKGAITGQASENPPNSLPKLAILAGGGKTTKKEVLYTVRQKLPLIIFEGSGGLADEIFVAYKNRVQLQNDPVLAEIIEDGDIHFHSLNNSVKGIERLIIRELGDDKVLLQAWETFADYDLNAKTQQEKFDTLQKAILAVGILGTLLVIIQQVFGPRDIINNPNDIISNNLVQPKELFANGHYLWWLLYYFLILVPILLTVLITAATRFKQGSKWLLLRAAAESIKREIYRYRTRAMYYNELENQQAPNPQTANEQQPPAAIIPKLSPEQQLSKKVEEITLRTMRTEVNLSSLKPYDKNKGFPPDMFGKNTPDDGFSTLSPDRYVEVRLGDQLNYFKRRSIELDQQLTVIYWSTFIIGGLGTFLAAIGMQIWIALTTSMVAAFGTYLGYRQTENTLTKYNQAATDLTNVKGWWNALSAEEQAQQINIDSLVEHTEQVLQSELDGWIQQMQNALAELRKGQEAPKEKEEKKEPVTPNSTNGKTEPKKQEPVKSTPENGNGVN